MALPKLPIFLAYVVAGILPLALVPPVLRNREKPGGAGLLVVIIGASIWSFAAGIGFLIGTPMAAFAVSNVVLLAASLTAIGSFLTVVDYIGLLTPTRGIVAGLAVEPIAVQVLAWTNQYHHLVYQKGATFESIQALIASYRLVFWVHAALMLLFVDIAILLAISEVVTSRGVRREQSLALVVAPLPPVVANLWFLNVSREIDLTPFGFVLTVFVLGWALFRAQFLDLAPVGRDIALEEMDDAVVTVDTEDRVVDCNPAARRLLDADEDYVGTPIQTFASSFPELIDCYPEGDASETGISVEQGGTTRHFDLDITPLRGPNDERAGRLLVLRDITLRREREAALQEREEDLDLLRQVLARVLRHNIRNELTVIRGYGEVFEDEFEGDHGEMAAELVSKADDLIEISAKARTIEQLVEEDHTPHEVDLVTMLEEIVASVEASFPGVTVALDAPDSCLVETMPSMELAIENLVENAAEHGTGNRDTQPVTGHESYRPPVRVTLDCSEKQAVVTVADDGPGILDQEIAVLDAGEETPLQHGSGIGLWVVQWVLDNSEATIGYETDEDGTEISVQIPR